MEKDIDKHYTSLYEKAKRHFDSYVEYYGGMKQEQDRVYNIGKGPTKIFIIAGVHAYEGDSTFPAITECFNSLIRGYKHLLEKHRFHFILTKPNEDPQFFLENQINKKKPIYVLDLHCASRIYHGFFIEGTVSNNKEKTVEVARPMLEEVKRNGFEIFGIKEPEMNYPIKIKSDVKGLAMGGIAEDSECSEIFDLEADALVYSALQGAVSLTLESYDNLPGPHIAAIEGFYKYLSGI